MTETQPVRVTDPGSVLSIVPLILGYQPGEGDLVLRGLGERGRLVITLRVHAADLDREAAGQLRPIMHNAQRNVVQAAILVGYGKGETITPAMDAVVPIDPHTPQASEHKAWPLARRQTGLPVGAVLKHGGHELIARYQRESGQAARLEPRMMLRSARSVMDRRMTRDKGLCTTVEADRPELWPSREPCDCQPVTTITRAGAQRSVRALCAPGWAHGHD
jgi:hypothetical protein